MRLLQMNKFALVSCAGFLCLGTLSAQEVSHFSFDVGGGFTTPVGNTGRLLGDGWNVQGGVGYNFSNYLGVMGQLDYNSMGMNGAALGTSGFPGGDIHVFSATIDPIVHLTPKSHFDVYAIGGGGLYHWYQQFSAPTGLVSNSFAGSFPLVIPNIGDQYSVNKPGWNAGMGVAMGTKWHGKVFAEARYVHIFLNNGERGDYVPVTFGYRW
jgi:Outer membrane protein beta-barrel domain